MTNINANDIIEILGGTSAVAKMTGVKMPSVSGWKSTGIIPKDKLIMLAPEIENVSGGKYTREMLLPDCWQRIWGELKKERL